MKTKFLFITVFFFLSLIYSQEIGFGVGFSPYDVSSSTITIKFKEDFIEKIFLYFKDKDEEIFQIQVSSPITNKKNNFLVSQSSFTKNLTLDEVKKIFFGFGKIEMIRILLIKQKKKDINLRNLVELRKKGRTIEEIAKRYDIDFRNDIWLESKKIYSEIFEPEEE